MSRKELGEWGEVRARDHLQQKGFRILDRNWSCREGEVDLVALEGETIVFVEVKTRTSHKFGRPEESLTSEKQRRLQRTAWSYLQENEVGDSDWRIDVIAIDRGEDGRVLRLDHYRNAVADQGDLT